MAAAFSIQLFDVGKRYRDGWVLKDLRGQFESGTRYAITGPNGSGKSTLLKMICGYLTPTVGRVTHLQNGKEIHRADIYRYISYAAPYTDLPEELTYGEVLNFYTRLKPLRSGVLLDELPELFGIEAPLTRHVQDFSSGMKQRLRIGLACVSDTPLLILDEPATNLDTKAVDHIARLIDRFAEDRLIIIASNDERDLVSCKRSLNVLDYKS